MLLFLIFFLSALVTKTSVIVRPAVALLGLHDVLTVRWADEFLTYLLVFLLSHYYHYYLIIICLLIVNFMLSTIHGGIKTTVKCESNFLANKLLRCEPTNSYVKTASNYYVAPTKLLRY